MYKVWVIAHREYVAMVGTKAFLFSLVMMPILMFGGLILMPALQKVSGGKTLKILVVDGTDSLFDELKQAAEGRNAMIRSNGRSDANPDAMQRGQHSASESKQEDFMQSLDYWELSSHESSTLTEEERSSIYQLIKKGEIDALFEVHSELFDKPELDQSALQQGTRPVANFVSFDSVMNPARMWFAAMLTAKVKSKRIEQFAMSNIDPRVLQLLESKIDVAPLTPNSLGKEGQSTFEVLKAMFLPFGIMMLMFMVILMAAQPMLESAMDEKTLRISEVLIGSVSATQLLGGKLIGNVAGSIVIFLLYGCGGIFVLNSQDMLSAIPMSLIPWFILFQVLGVLFYSSIFLIVGASVNELKEAQSILLPVWMFLMAPLMVWFIAVRDPNGSIAVGLSFFPPSSPLTMVLRLATQSAIPWWHPYLAATIMMVSTYFMVALAGKIYRIGLLRLDGVRSIFQLIRRATQKA